MTGIGKAQTAERDPDSLLAWIAVFSMREEASMNIGT